MTPNVRSANGGLDANWMVRHGIPTVTFGAGQNEAHTIDEWIDLTEFEAGYRQLPHDRPHYAQRRGTALAGNRRKF